MSRWLIRAAVSTVMVGILLAIIPIDAVLDAIGRISIWTWAASLGIFFAGHYLNAVKLRLILGSDAAPLSACVQAQYAGLVANLGLPGLAGGDLVRAAYLVPTAGVKRVAGASIADRLLDSATLLILVAIALPLAGVPPAVRRVLPGLGWSVGLAAIALGLLAAAVIALRKKPLVSNALNQARLALQERRAGLAGAVAISVGVQAAFVMTNSWLAREVGVSTPVACWFVAWPLSKLIAVLPISLGGIGVREAALVSLLAPYGAPENAVLASGILWQTVLMVSGLVGLIATQWMWRPRSIDPQAVPKGNG
jgi:uncharacterized membrane protein YbhN (UPF0104 family)